MKWEKAFKQIILDRGYDYYERGLVTDFRATQTSVTATVVGTSSYVVEIPLKDGRAKVRSGYCDCPYAQDGHACKHMAAVLYDWSERNPTPPDATSQGTVGDKLVAQATDSQVRLFLATVLDRDPQMQHVFRRIIAVDDQSAATSLVQYQDTIATIFESYSDESNFIDYEAATDFCNDLVDFIDQEVQPLVDRQLGGLAMQVIETIYEKMARIDIDDSDGESMIIVQACMNLWDQAIRQANLLERQQLFEWLSHTLASNPDNAFADSLEQFWLDHFQDPESLRFKLQFTAAQLKTTEQSVKSWARDDQAAKWAAYHLQIMGLLKRPFKEIQAFCEQHVAYHDVRLYYVDQCIKHHDDERAIELLQEGKAKASAERLGGLLVQDSVKLKDLYYQLGRYRDYQQELWRLVVDYQPADVAFFRELKQQFSTKAWETKRAQLFAALPANADVARLYAEEHLDQELLKTVLAEPNLNGVMTYEHQLKARYSVQLLDKYQQVLQKMAEPTGTRQSYRKLTRILQHMLTYPGGAGTVRIIVTDWRRRYPRRSAMLDEISQLRF